MNEWMYFWMNLWMNSWMRASRIFCVTWHSANRSSKKFKHVSVLKVLLTNAMQCNGPTKHWQNVQLTKMVKRYARINEQLWVDFSKLSINQSVNEWIYPSMFVAINEKINDRLNVWINEWMNKWSEEWMKWWQTEKKIEH